MNIKIDKTQSTWLIVIGVAILLYAIYNELDKADTINIGEQIQKLKKSRGES